MSTIKQERALEKMVENGGNVSQAMRDVGYSENTAKTPQKLTESLGFIELCDSKGLTDDLLINALVEDIKEKKGNRRAELELAFKIKGKLVNKTDIKSEDKQITGMQIMFDNSFNKSMI
ncbi:MAG: hypothetical protein QG644_490 [Patescibacteria group bacterium]|nr:hypothetical protein [Patescibacteria group bacterium]